MSRADGREFRKRDQTAVSEQLAGRVEGVPAWERRSCHSSGNGFGQRPFYILQHLEVGGPAEQDRQAGVSLLLRAAAACAELRLQTEEHADRRRFLDSCQVRKQEGYKPSSRSVLESAAVLRRFRGGTVSDASNSRSRSRHLQTLGEIR